MILSPFSFTRWNFTRFSCHAISKTFLFTFIPFLFFRLEFKSVCLVYLRLSVFLSWLHHERRSIGSSRWTEGKKPFCRQDSHLAIDLNDKVSFRLQRRRMPSGDSSSKRDESRRKTKIMLISDKGTWITVAGEKSLKNHWISRFSSKVVAEEPQISENSWQWKKSYLALSNKQHVRGWFEALSFFLG